MTKLVSRLLAGAGWGLALGVAGGALTSAVYVVRSAYVERGMLLVAAHEWNRYLFRTALSVVIMGIVYAAIYHVARRIARQRETAQAVTASLAAIQVASTFYYMKSHGTIIQTFLSSFQGGDKLDAALQARIFADSEGGWSLLTIGLVLAAFIAVYALAATPAVLVLRPLFRRLNRAAVARWPWNRIVRTAALTGAGVLALSLALPRLVASGNEPSVPRVILISLDTVGAEYLGAYGDPDARTPVLDRFMKRAALFADVSVAEPFTLTSHITMMTSLYPGAQQVNLTTSLAQERITLAEMFREHGYETGGFSTSSWLDPIFGFDQGFAYYSNTVRAPADALNRAAFRWLKLFHSRPFFLFLHYYDAHSDPGIRPYDAPSPFPELFTRDVPGGFDGCLGEDCATWLLLKVDQGDVLLSPAEAAAVRGYYYAGIAWLDAQLEDVFNTLSALGLWEDALIAVTADHGEQMLQHGGTMHEHLYQEVLRVPLAVRLPRQAEGRVIGEPVQSIDVPPTLLAAAGLPVPLQFQGRDHAAALSGGRVMPTARYSTSTSLPGTMLIPGYAVEDGRYKLIVRAGSEVQESLYDTVCDPGEVDPLDPAAVPEAGRLRAALQEWTAENRLRAEDLQLGDAPLLDPAAQEELRALGYLN